jgi:hypothetical protein
MLKVFFFFIFVFLLISFFSLPIMYSLSFGQKECFFENIRCYHHTYKGRPVATAHKIEIHGIFLDIEAHPLDKHPLPRGFSLPGLCDAGMKKICGAKSGVCCHPWEG